MHMSQTGTSTKQQKETRLPEPNLKYGMKTTKKEKE